jgi:hypothetical protein
MMNSIKRTYQYFKGVYYDSQDALLILVVDAFILFALLPYPIAPQVVVAVDNQKMVTVDKHKRETDAKCLLLVVKHKAPAYICSFYIGGQYLGPTYF